MTADVVVIGGGITGLATAHALTRRGRRVVVLETAARAGGLIRTDRIDGFTIEAGPDSLLASKSTGVELVRELGLGSELLHVRTPGAFVLRGHGLYSLPSPSLLGLPLTWRALAAYELLSWTARLRLSLEPRIAPRQTADDESVASFFRRRFGEDTVDLIAQPLLGGIHAGNIEQLSMRSLFPRLVELEQTQGSVLGKKGTATFFREKRGQPSGSPFVSLHRGMGSLVAALVGALPPDSIRFGAAAEEIIPSAEGWRVSANGDVHVAPNLVLAAPAHVVARLIAPIDAAAADLCARVPYVSTASVALAWRGRDVPHPMNGTGFVVARHHSDVRITAATWVSAKWDARAPQDAVLIRAFLGGEHDRAAVDLTDAEMIAAVRRDLGAVMTIVAEPILARVYRWRDAGAQHTVGHLRRVDEIEQRLRAHGQIYVAGAGFRSVGIPDCVADAKRVAAAISGTD